MNDDEILDQYFANKLNEYNARPDIAGLSERVDTQQNTLESKRQARIARLEQIGREQQARETAYAESHIGKKGYDPQGIVGSAENLGAVLKESTSRLVGHILDSPNALATQVNLNTLPPEVLEANKRILFDAELRDRQQAAEKHWGTDRQMWPEDIRASLDIPYHTQEGDEELLQRTSLKDPNDGLSHIDPKFQKTLGNLGGSLGEPEHSRTFQERLDLANTQIKVTNLINDRFDRSADVHRGRQEALSEDAAKVMSAEMEALSKAGDDFQKNNIAEAIKGGAPALGTLLVKAGPVLSEHPMATLEHIAGTVPDVVVGARNQALRLAIGMGYGSKAYAEGIAEYQKEHGGAMPSKDEMQKRAAYALATGAANYAEVGVLGKYLPNSLTGKLAGDGVKKGVLRSAGEIGAVSQFEGGIEVFQEFSEAKAAGRDATPEELYEAFVIGVGAAGGMATPSVIGREIKNRGKGPTTLAEEQAQREADTARVEANDVGDIANPDSKEYSPKRAVSVLGKIHNKEDQTPEVKEKALQDITRIITQMEEDAEPVRKAYAESEAYREDQANRIIENADEALANADTPEARKKEKNRLQAAKNIISSLKERTSETVRDHRALQGQVKAVEAEIQNALNVREAMKQQSQVTEETIEVNIAQANLTEAEGGNRESVASVINLAMASPDRVSPEQALALAQNTENTLTASEREFFVRFSEAQQAAHALKSDSDVASDVFQGGDGYVGIDQYRSRFESQVFAGNIQGARSQLQGIEAFALQRERKSEAVNKALEDISQEGSKVNRIDLTPSKDGGWGRMDTFFPNAKARTAAGGVTVTSGTARLAGQIGLEAQAVRAASNELRAALNVQTENQQTETSSSQTPPAAETPITSSVSSAETVQEPSTPSMSPSRPAATEASVEAPEPVEAKTGTSPEASNETGVVTPESSTEAPKAATRAPAKNVELRKSKGLPAKSVVRQGADNNKIFAFGENYRERQGGALAGLREEPNTVGIRTQWEPKGGSPEAKFGQNPALEKEIITEDVERLASMRDSTEGSVVVMPMDGISPNLIEAAKESPAAAEVYAHLQSELGKHGLLQDGMTEAEGIEQTQTPTEDVTALTTETETEPTLAEEAPQNETLVESNEPAQSTVTEPSEDFSSEVPVSEPAQNNDADLPGEGTLENIAKANETPQVSGHVDPADVHTANLLTAYLKQDDRNLHTRLTKNPFVEVKNFITALGLDPELAQKFVSQELTDKQKQLINGMVETLSEWNSDIMASLPEWNEKSLFNRLSDYTQYFRNEENGTLEENVASAISLGMFEYLADNANSPYLLPAQLNNLMGKESKAPISTKQWETVGQVGQREAYVANEIGRRIVQALGLKLVGGAPRDVLTKFEGSLGAHAVGVMKQLGLLEYHEVSAEDWANWTEQELTLEYIDSSHKFVRVPTEGPSRDEAKRINELTSGTNSLLSKMFGMEDINQPPADKPAKFKETAKNTDIPVPKTQSRILKKENKKATRIHTNRWNVWKQLSEKDQLVIAEGVDLDSQNTHQAELRSLQAKNDGLMRENRNFAEYVNQKEQSEGGIDAPFFLNREVWKMGRMGLIGRMVNPQSSKIHRGLTYMEGQEQVISLADPEPHTEYSDSTAVDKFWLAVADTFGIKTDLQMDADSILEAQEKADSPVYKKGVDAVVKAMEGEPLSSEDSAAISAAVQEAGEGMYSFAGLEAMASLRYALKHGEEGFEHSLTREIDGKTNGPMLTTLLMGAASSIRDLLGTVSKGGFFTQAEGVTSNGEWAQRAGNNDLYESIMTRIINNAAITLQINPRFMPFYSAHEFFTGGKSGQLGMAGRITSAGRNLVKTPTTATVFGSGINSIVRDMGKEFAGAIHSQITAMSNIKDAEERHARKQEIITHLQNIYGKGFIRDDMSIKQLLAFNVEGRNLDVLQKQFRNTVGKDIKKAVEDEFGTFIERRNTHAKAANLSFQLFNTAYSHERNKYINELLGSEIAFKDVTNKAGEVSTQTYQDLTPAQEAEVLARVKKVVPMVHSAFSKIDGNIETGMMLAKTARKFDSTFTYSNSARFNPGWGVKAMKPVASRGQRIMYEAPGVGSMIWQAHSTDAYISAMAQEVLYALNAHDALIVGLDQDIEASQALNMHTFKILVEYSPFTEIVNTLEKTLTGFAEYMDEGDLKNNRTAVRELEATLYDILGDDFTPGDLANTLNDMRREARQADAVRLRSLREIAYVNQYNLEGGHYEVTDADRARIDVLLAESQQRSEANQSVDRVVELLEGKTAKAVDQGKAIETSNPSTEVTAEPASVDYSDDGNRTDVSIEPGFNSLEGITEQGEASIQRLETILKDGRSKATSLLKLAAEVGDPAVKALLNRLDKNKLVSNIAIEQSTDMNESAPLGNTRIETDAEGNTTQTISINTGKIREVITGPEGNLTNNSDVDTVAEVISHELVHGATARVLNAAGKKGEKLRSRIEGIQRDISAWRNENKEAHNNLDQDTKSALNLMESDAQEVLSYGMTAKRVQRVLRVIPSTDNKGQHTGSSTWSKFVGAMREALGLTTKEASVLDEIISVTEEATSEAQDTTPAQGSLSLNMETPRQGEGSLYFTSKEIFDSLGDPQTDYSTENQANLNNLLNSIVEGLHGPYGAFKERARQFEVIEPQDVFLKALDKGEAPFVSEARTAGFNLDNQQAFVLEQVEATLAASMDTGTTSMYARRELMRVWKEASNVIQASDLLTVAPDKATQAQWDKAEELRSFLFDLGETKVEQGNHLARFAALSMVHPGLKAKMDYTSYTRPTENGPRTLSQKLLDAFKKIMGIFHDHMAKTRDGQEAGKKVWDLMERLVDIEARHRASMANDSYTWKEHMEEGLGKGLSKAGDAVVGIANSNFIKNRKPGYITGAAKLTAVVAEGRVTELLQDAEKVRADMAGVRKGTVAKLISEAQGAYDTYSTIAQKILREVSIKNEQERTRQHTIHRQAVLESFDNDGKDLTDNQKEQITRIGLDTNMSALLDRHTQAEILEMAHDSRARNKAIKAYERELGMAANPDNLKYYKGAARYLAWHMATGDVVSKHQYLNTHNIAKLYGTQKNGTVSEVEANAIREILSPLVSLMALDNSDPAARNEFVDVMTREHARGKRSGIAMVLNLHKQMQEKDLEIEFGGDRSLMQEGYRSHIYDDKKTITTAPLSERSSYEAMGYKLVSTLESDPNDPDQVQKGLFVVSDGGQVRRITGIVSYMGEAMRGTGIHQGTASLSQGKIFKANENKNAKVLKERDEHIQFLFEHGDTVNPAKESKKAKSFLAPTYNRDGEVVNYRYLMKQDTKDNVLRRNNRVEDVFGAMASSSFDKVASKEQNRIAIQALKDQYDADYLDNPELYMRVALDSEDAQLSEAMKLLPPDAQKAVKEIWGKQEMWVRNDLVDINFGYQKMSMASAFKADPAEREGIQAVLASVVEGMFEAVYNMRDYSPEKSKQMRKRAYLRVRRAENVWEELVSELKDILVIKTGTTLMMNVLSNTSLLVWHGVSYKDIARDHAMGIDGALSYKRDYFRKQKLQVQLDTGNIQDRKAAIQEIRQLDKELEASPVAFMIEAGLMPSIVEDVNMHKDPYSYKSGLIQKTEKWSNKLPKGIRDAGRQLYMAEDTAMYKALSQSTQLSDFVARYTLYNHLTNRKRNPMTHEDAVQRASDMFVNYDIPSSRGMQKANDLGFLMFTKYYLRIQKSIITLYREQPAQALLMNVLGSMIPGLSLLTDSEMSSRLGNPLRDGALSFPEGLGEIATVKAALSPFK